jgi:hypothetical protein
MTYRSLTSLRLFSAIAQAKEDALGAQKILASVSGTLTHVADHNDISIHAPSPCDP